MSVRKRSWVTNGEQREAWVVNYTDLSGARRLKTFKRKKDADAYHAKVTVDMRTGIHTPDSSSTTIAEAAKLWLDRAATTGLERTTVEQYVQHLKFHIAPLIGEVKLSRFTAPMARAFEDQLARDRSPIMVRKVYAFARRHPGRRPRARAGGAECRAQPATGAASPHRPPAAQITGRSRHPHPR